MCQEIFSRDCSSIYVFSTIVVPVSAFLGLIIIHSSLVILDKWSNFDATVNGFTAKKNQDGNLTDTRQFPLHGVRPKANTSGII
jgi:hypothetical protein